MGKRLKSQKRSLKHYKVDIVTPVYGGLDLLKKLVDSMLAHDAGVEYHWILVDDATPEEQGRAELIRYLRRIESEHDHITVIENKVNGGYSKANNIGVRKGRSDNILLLNSDTMILEDGWLERLLKNFESPAVGIAGARLLYFPDSTDPARPAEHVQHAGVVFDLLGQPYHIFMGWPADHPKVNERRQMQAVTGACLLIRKSVWNDVGGLAEVYTKGNFEDVELCVRARFRGYVIIYDPTVTLYHYAGGSDNTETIGRNWQIFKMRNIQIVTYDEWKVY